MAKESFFSRLAKIGQTNDEDEMEYEEDDIEAVPLIDDEEDGEDFASEGELSVDVYRNNDEIVIKAMVPGVAKEDLEIQLSRESLTLRGVRHDEAEVHEDHYQYRELYWGSFSRTIHLPEEVDIDKAEAHEDHGILTLRLPIMDKKRQSKLKLK